VYVVTCICEVSPLLSFGVHIRVMFSVFHVFANCECLFLFISIVFCYGNRDVDFFYLFVLFKCRLCSLCITLLNVAIFCPPE
jgi:hypothetical protein